MTFISSGVLRHVVQLVNVRCCTCVMVTSSSTVSTVSMIRKNYRTHNENVRGPEAAGLGISILRVSVEPLHDMDEMREESARGGDRPVEASVACAVAGLHSTASFLLLPTTTLFFVSLRLPWSGSQEFISISVVWKALLGSAMVRMGLAGSRRAAPTRTR